MEINKEIYIKATTILADREQKLKEEQLQREYIDTCIEAGICPDCGKPIRVEEKYDQTIITCSANILHYGKSIYKPESFD